MMMSLAKPFLILIGIIAFSKAQLGHDVCSNEDLTATSDLKTISSPNFPNSYPINVHCTTHITSPQNTVIELTFHFFQFEDSEDCDKDYLQIIGGVSDNLLYPDCGRSLGWPGLPDKVVSTSNDMTITFVTDYQTNSLGFNATFRAVQPSPHILIMTENSTFRIIRRYNEKSFLVTPNGIMDPLAVDYDPRTQHLYYSDRGAKTIGRIYTGPSKLQDVLHSEHIQEPFGLRIDVNSRLLYWTDAELGTISVSNLDGEYRNTLVNSELDKPGAIVTEPYRGYIYFTNWGAVPKIERADGDGRNRLVLVPNRLVSPRSLTIDLKERKLYWIDSATMLLESVNYDGTDRDTLKSVSLLNVFSLVLDDDGFFCSGFFSSSSSAIGLISYFDRKINNDASYIRWGSDKYYKGISLRPLHEPDVIVPDTCPTATCNQLCLPKPNGQHRCLAGVGDFTTPPVFINCPDTISVWVAPGAFSSLVSWDDILLEDGVDVTISSHPMSGSEFYIGTETVAISATDFIGNMAWCNFSVTVTMDNVPPVILPCPGDISVTFTSLVETEHIVTWIEPEVSDNAGEAHWLVRPSSSGTAFPIGSTHVTYIASDQFDNRAQCSFLVTVSAEGQETSSTDEYLLVIVGGSLGFLVLVAAIIISIALCMCCKNNEGRNNDQIVVNAKATEAHVNEHYVPEPTRMMTSSYPGTANALTISGGSVQYTNSETDPYYMQCINAD